jgi:hypothetical protein
LYRLLLSFLQRLNINLHILQVFGDIGAISVQYLFDVISNLVVIVEIEIGSIVEEVKPTLVQIPNIVLSVHIIELIACSDVFPCYIVVSIVKGCAL